MGLEPSDKWQLDQSMPMSPQINRILRERIIQNDLNPGDRLSESEVALVYGVSRQPVREAFIKLSDQGLVVIRPQRGTVVSRISFTAVLDARFLREAIEADIIAILASSPDPALIRELRHQVETQTAIPLDRPKEFGALDDLFHRTLAEAAGKGGAWKQIEGLKSQMDRVRFLSLGRFPRAKLIGQHSDLITQIERSNASAAARAIRCHLREILNDLLTIVDANRAFFELPPGELPRPVNAPIHGGD